MSLLESALRRLSDVALAPEGHPQTVLAEVRHVLQALGDADIGTRDRLLNHFAELIDQADGPRASAIALGCGSLVESGADANIALVPILTHLPDLLAGGSTFADACSALADETTSENVVEQFGAQVAEQMPREAQAWLALEPMGLGAIALLSRSRVGRDNARREPGLVAGAAQLAPLHSRMWFLTRLLQVLEDERLVVLHPGQQRGYYVRINGCADNFQLQTLLADALIGEPDAGWLVGIRPNPRVVAVARDQPADAETPVAEASFNLWTWRGLQADGTLPEGMAGSEFWIWNEGIPAEIPAQGLRIVLLGRPPYSRSWNASRCFEGLVAGVVVERKLGREEVLDYLHHLAVTNQMKETKPLQP